MSEITIPDEAWSAAMRAYNFATERVSAKVQRALTAAAPLIVAADRQHRADSLRTLTARLDADGIDVSQDVEEIIGDLERGAAELRAQTPTTE
jgi:hypothetical protein